MKNTKKLFALIVVLSLILAFASGCINEGDETSAESSHSETESSYSETESTYPELTVETSNDGNRIYDTMDYSFIPHDEMVGEWKAVNSVKKIEDFEEGKLLSTHPEKLYFQSCTFYDGGVISCKFSNYSVTENWTKGYVLFTHSGVIPAYTLEQINGKIYMFIEWKIGDYPFDGEVPCYYVFEKTSDNAVLTVKEYDNISNINITSADFSGFGENILTLKFNQKTVFPSKDKMPSQDEYQPDYILEAGKNPGLGVRSIHEQGITGKGVTVAIIDQPLYIDSHPEYTGKIIEYKDFGCELEYSMHGPAVTSLLVGETTGTAPGAKIYYAAVPSGKGDATYYADALDWITETNKNLPAGEKIRAVSISAGPTPENDYYINGEKYLESVKRATEAGILVLDCSIKSGKIGSCRYDYNNPEDVSLCKSGSISRSEWGNKNHILAPVSYRTIAEEHRKGDFSYQYVGDGGQSWAIPYVAGVLAMGWEINAELSADEIVQILFDTAYVDSNGNKYVCPTAFVDYLK